MKINRYLHSIEHSPQLVHHFQLTVLKLPYRRRMFEWYDIQ